MISLPIHDQLGKPTGRTYEFDPAELASGINKQLLHDAVVMYQANLRQGTFKTKSRSEIAGSNKKLFKQKGTGNARMGNKRTCLRRGGGHAFAKRPTDFSYRMPKKALRLATRTALLSKFLDGEAIVVDGLAFDKPKTKTVYNLLKTLQIVERPRPGAQPATGDAKPKAPKRPVDQSCLIATEKHDPIVYKSARNLPNVSVSPAVELNAYKLLQKKRLIVTTTALDQLRGKTQAN